MRSRLTRLLSAALLAALTLCLAAAPALAQSVFLNELHYDNTGTDAGEAFEIAGPAGTDLSSWSVEFYNGANGNLLATVPLSGTIPDQDDGCGTLGFTQAPIQNGAPDGLAVIDDSGAVVQMLSWEGSFTPDQGTANGILSTDIGVAESSSTAVGDSLQLIGGPGSDYSDFTWQDPADDSFGAVNTGQDFLCTPQVTAEKVDELGDDVYGDGYFSPGDTIHYVVTIENDDVGARAKNVMFHDDPDDKTSLVVGSVTTTKGSVVTGNNPGDTEVLVDLNGINQGKTETVEFDVLIFDPLFKFEIEEGVTNQGTVSGNNFDDVLTDDPDVIPNPCNGSDAYPTHTPLEDICKGVVVTETCRVNGSVEGRPCQGTGGPDVIIGSDGPDVIKGRGGDDNIVGKKGRDLICGDGGDDFIEGNEGADRLDGGGGDDIVRGAAGNDVVTGAGGADDLFGDGGRDILEGGPGLDDKLDGGLAKDICFDLDIADTIIIRCNELESCGLGFELVGVLPALLWARKRRRAARVA